MSSGQDRGSVVAKLERNGHLTDVKSWKLKTHYEVIMGSTAYGVANNTSDMDMYGVYCPPIDMIFPEASGTLRGFGPQINFKNVDSFQRHHIIDGHKEYDLSLYSIIMYFNKCMDNNPNMIDSLFVPDRCIVHQDAVGEIMRENRRIFLHKGIHKKLMGYAFGEFKKIKSQTREGKRAASIEEFGYDVKNAYHVVRLVQQAEMVLTHHDLDLEENRELLKSVRRGEWTLQDLDDWFKIRREQLDGLYITSELRLVPEYDMIKRLLMQCLEAKFGSLSAYFNIEGSDKIAQDKLARIKEIANE